MSHQFDAKEKSSSVRGAIITLRGAVHWEFSEIARLSGLDVSTSGARKIWDNATTSAQIALGKNGPIPWQILLDYTESNYRSGRPKVVGVEEKTKLREEYLSQPDKAFHDVAVNSQQLNISTSTARNIARSPSPRHDYRIVKRKRPKKFVLREEDAIYRKDYCKWLNNLLLPPEPGYVRPRTIFVMSDETPINFGGPSKHSDYVSVPEGTKASLIPPQMEDSHPKFTLQTLAACCSDLSQTRPVKVFQKEEINAKEETIKQLEKAHQMAVDDSKQLIEDAEKDPNSQPAEAVRQANIDMHIQHKKDLEMGKKGTPKTKRELKPYQVFKVDAKDFERTAEKGMDFAWYMYNWLIPHLYPYYHKVKAANPDANVYLIEDNSGAHIKARRMMRGKLISQGIDYAPHPGNSPDLHPIERIFDGFGDALQGFIPTGNSKEEVERAKRWIIDEWQTASQFGERLVTCTDSQYFIELAGKCLDADGWSTFHG